jgi:hypothetical protein
MPPRQIKGRKMDLRELVMRTGGRSYWLRVMSNCGLVIKGVNTLVSATRKLVYVPSSEK